MREVEEYVRGLGLDAYVVGGAVRDELLGLESKDADFLVPGVDHAQLRAALEPHGRVEDLEVAGQRVGARLYPNDKGMRRLVPAGIEFAPPRVERSTGPGRHDFEIVADPSVGVAGDMRRRDFTVNAMARRLETGELVDPTDGQADLERRVLRTVSPRSFDEDPLRLVRALRFISQLDFEPDPEMLEQMRETAPSVRLVSAERIGGGLAADGHGELSKLLLGAHPEKALRFARDTGVLQELIPEFGSSIGFVDPQQGFRLDDHIFAVVQAASDRDKPLQVRLAALLHDLGRPEAAGDVTAHAAAGAEIARAVLLRLRYPNRLRARVVAIVREHAFQLDGADELFARRFLRRHGDELAFDLIDHKEIDIAAKGRDTATVDGFRALVEREQAQPHSLRDLALGGEDLLELGFPEGPVVGHTLEALLDAVVEDPSLNERTVLVERARELLP